MENNISLDQIKKQYSSITGKINALKQKKYKAIEEFIENTQRIYFDDTIENKNEEIKIQEEELKRKLNELNIQKQEQLEILKEHSSLCKKKMEEYYEELNKFADTENYFKRIYECDKSIEKIEKIFGKYEIPFFMENDRKEKQELINEKENLIDMLSQIIPDIKSDDIKKYEEKYKEELKNKLEQQRKELIDYSTLYIKIENITSEKTNEDLALLEIINSSKRKRVINEIKESLKKQNDDTYGIEKTQELSLEEIKKEEAKRKNENPISQEQTSTLTPEKINKMDLILEGVMQQKAKQNEQQSVIDKRNQQMKEMAEKRKLQLQKLEEKQRKQIIENNAMQQQGSLLTPEKISKMDLVLESVMQQKAKQQASTLTPEKISKMDLVLESVMQQKEKQQASTLTPEKISEMDKVLESVIQQKEKRQASTLTPERIKEMDKVLESVIQQKEKRQASTLTPERIKEMDKVLESIISKEDKQQENIPTSERELEMETALNNLISQKQNSTQTLEKSPEPEHQEQTDYLINNPWISQEIPIEAKVSRSVPIENKQRMCKQIEKKVSQYFDIEQNENNMTK